MPIKLRFIEKLNLNGLTDLLPCARLKDFAGLGSFLAVAFSPKNSLLSEGVMSARFFLLKWANRVVVASGVEIMDFPSPCKVKRAV